MLGESLRRRRGLSGAAKQSAPARPGRRLDWKRWLIGGAVAVLVFFLIGYAVAVWVLFPAPEQQAVGAAVPELAGLTVPEARERLQAAGLALDSVQTMTHPTRAEGVVLAQAPLPGQQLHAGAGVNVAVSAGPSRTAVPDVRGFDGQRAEALLRESGFQVTRREQLSDAPAGQVVGIEPAPGTELQVPARVVLQVSSGPPLPTFDTLTPPDGPLP